LIGRLAGGREHDLTQDIRPDRHGGRFLEDGMSKVTGITGPASEALFHVLNGGEYASTQFGLLRNKKTGRYDDSAEGTTRIEEARKYSADDVNYLPIDSALHEWVWVNAVYSLEGFPENDPGTGKLPVRRLGEIL
jgi:hypothetical protein